MLSTENIRRIAHNHHYHEVQINEESRVISFKNFVGDVRVNVYYTTGTVATCLDHPHSGKTQLFRRNQTESDLNELFKQPRTHTGVGYYRCQSNQGQFDPSRRKNRRAIPVEECDDVRRWRYVSEVTDFCCGTQGGQIAAIAKLWHSLRFRPGGRSVKDHWDSFPDEVKQSLPFRVCCDSDNSECGCSERSGAFCSLMSVISKIATEHYNVVCYYNPDAKDPKKDIALFLTQVVTQCKCPEGIEFKRIYGTMLAKLDRQFRSLPRDVFREVYLWYADKMSHGRMIPVVDRGGEQEPEILCSNNRNILQCHRDYGKMMYGESCRKGCHCHGS